MLNEFIRSSLINKKVNVHVLLPHEVRQRIRNTRNSSLIKVLERHFIDTSMKSPGRQNVHPPVKLAGNEDDLVDDF